MEASHDLTGSAVIFMSVTTLIVIEDSRDRCAHHHMQAEKIRTSACLILSQINRNAIFKKIMPLRRTC